MGHFVEHSGHRSAATEEISQDKTCSKFTARVATREK